MVFFVGRPENSPDSITQEWITTQRLIQKEASDKRDLVQTGQHLLKFMNVINSACSSVPKGQLISKANFQAVNSSKKRTNEFIFTSMRCVFVRFLEEIEDNKKAFRNCLTFSSRKNSVSTHTELKTAFISMKPNIVHIF